MTVALRRWSFTASTRWLAVLVVGGSASIGGCRKAEDCNALASVTNRRAAEISSIEERGSRSADPLAVDMTELAKVADQAADDVHALELETDDVQTKARAYEDVAHELATASRSFSELMRGLGEYASSRAKIEAEFERTGSALLETCESASVACNAVGDILRKQPIAPSPDEIPEALTEYLEALEQLELEDNVVQTAVDARIAAARSYRTLATRGSSLNSDIESARARLHGVVERQNALIAELNTFCVGAPSP